ncbi:ATP-binding protein [Paenibacillus polysaccharolyticus]|uniref:AAA family ATPase n=1 Tax=Paenibacillus polysaccharolyticus TaxID=582692 RepID=UPI00203EECED|nr:ATP-binding protein [Paenibacillus polysaccharolyticus]MCM3134390.1 ATP-binding protein [Paenibacillus polysaccharolyticus]
MATANQIKMLIEAHVSKNDDRFRTIVLQLAAHEAKLGHTSFAREIRNILNSKSDNDKNLIQFNKDVSELIDITISYGKLSELIVTNELKERINRVLNEYRKRDKLKKFGLNNRRKILLEGQPGTGKTLTASIVACELGLPLCTIKMDKLMTKYMGETGSKLRIVFDAIRENQAVYLFDEFDAIGTDRSKDNDVGEVRRILNLFLQFIEQDSSESLIIAATNNRQLLDPALFRRFDDVLNYTLPNENQIPDLILNRLGQFTPNDADMDSILTLSKSLSHADLTKACDDAIKEAIMSDRKIVDIEQLKKMIKEKIR